MPFQSTQLQQQGIIVFKLQCNDLKIFLDFHFRIKI